MTLPFRGATMLRSCALAPDAATATVETVRPDGTRQVFALADCGGWLESVDTIPEPHQFTAHVHVGGHAHAVAFEEHAHGHDAHGH